MKFRNIFWIIFFGMRTICVKFIFCKYLPECKKDNTAAAKSCPTICQNFWKKRSNIPSSPSDLDCAFEREWSLLLLLCKNEPMIVAFPPSPHGPLTQSPFPFPNCLRKWTNFYNTPLQCWLLYPLLFAILCHYHAFSLYFSSLFFDLSFGRKIFVFLSSAGSQIDFDLCCQNTSTWCNSSLISFFTPFILSTFCPNRSCTKAANFPCLASSMVLVLPNVRLLHAICHDPKLYFKI